MELNIVGEICHTRMKPVKLQVQHCYKFGVKEEGKKLFVNHHLLPIESIHHLSRRHQPSLASSAFIHHPCTHPSIHPVLDLSSWLCVAAPPHSPSAASLFRKVTETREESIADHSPF